MIPISTVSNNRNHWRGGRFLRMPAILFWKTSSEMNRMGQTGQGRSIIFFDRSFPNCFSSSTISDSLFLPGDYYDCLFDLTTPPQIQNRFEKTFIIHSQLTTGGRRSGLPIVAKDVAVIPETLNNGG